MKPKFKNTDGSILLTDGLISEITGMNQENDQHIQLWINKSALYAIFSHPVTGDTNSFLRVPLKGSLLETHVTNTDKKCYIVRVAGIDSPFIFPQEKLEDFINASTNIET